MATYKIGQKMKLVRDIDCETMFGDKKHLTKGHCIWVGADEFAHHDNGLIQPIQDMDSVDGYEASGIAAFVMKYLKAQLPWSDMLEDMLEDYGIEKNDIEDVITEALEELGMY